MDTISLHGKTFEIFIRDTQIAERVEQVAASINSDYRDGEPPLVIVLLNGAFIFASDLCRLFSFDCDLQLLRVSSYQGMESTGTLWVDEAAEPRYKDRDILIIEDIVDTGNTIAAYLPRLYDKGAKSVKVASLLLKPKALKNSLSVDYVGMEIPSDFVIGYGLDYDGKGRNLPHIYKLKEA